VSSIRAFAGWIVSSGCLLVSTTKTLLKCFSRLRPLRDLWLPR
jgi:hypothetical protein